MPHAAMFPAGEGEHACHLFACTCEQMRVAARFLREGLTADEACIVLTRGEWVDGWYESLQATGIDVERERRREALAVVAGGARGAPGYFNSIVKAGELLRLFAARSHFAGVRVLADVGWGFEPALPADLLCHYEAAVDFALNTVNVRALCQYDLANTAPPALLAALRTHRTVILNEGRNRSPVFEAPRILANEPYLNHSSLDADDVRLVLGQLRTTAAEPSLSDR